MKLNRLFFQEFAKQKYLAYIRSFPQFKRDQAETYFMVILMVLTISFFGIFAIMPTLSTIAELKKTLEDSTFLNDQLKTKISNMSSLQEEYNLLAPNLPLLFAAIPQDIQATTLLGQIQKIAQDENITLTKLEIQEIPEIIDKNDQGLKSFKIMIGASATQFAQLHTFYMALTNFQRILTFNSIIITKNPETESLLLSIDASVYFMP